MFGKQSLMLKCAGLASEALQNRQTFASWRSLGPGPGGHGHSSLATASVANAEHDS